MEGVLENFDLERKDLDFICPRNIRDSVADKIIVDSYHVGRTLKVSDTRLNLIRHNTSLTAKDKAVAALDAWSEELGIKATCLQLAEALEAHIKTSTLVILCEKVYEMKFRESAASGPSSGSTAVSHQPRRCQRQQKDVCYVSRRVRDLEEEIDKLNKRLRCELEVLKVTADDLIDTLTFLPIALRIEYQESVKKSIPTCGQDVLTSVRQVFRKIINPLTTFLDYKLLEHLISKFGSPELKRDMADYVDDVNKFKRETTVAELMDQWDGIEDHSLNFADLKVRFGEDPTKCSLEKLDQWRKKYCSRHKLSEFVMILICLIPGSFIAVWQIPTVLIGGIVEPDAHNMDDQLIVISSVLVPKKQIFTAHPTVVEKEQHLGPRKLFDLQVSTANQAKSNKKSEGSMKDESKKASDLIETLMNNMSEINDPITKEEKTPLMDAVWKKDIERVKTLIALGADVHKLNLCNQTAYDSANFVLANSDDDERERLEAIRSLLEKVGGKTGHELIAEIAERDKDMRSERRLSTKLAGDRVLCLDNSSTMALVQLELLGQIEKATGKKITELFQWIVASGIGGLLVLLMVYDGRNISELRRFYFELHRRVFASSAQLEVKQKEFERVLDDQLGAQKSTILMSDVIQPKILIGAVNMRQSNLDLKFFSNCSAGDEDTQNVRKVAQYTCSSSIYSGGCEGYVDMGTLCKNPCDIGLSRIRSFYQKYPQETASVAVVISIGDGIPKVTVNPLMQYLASDQSSLTQITNELRGPRVFHNVISLLNSVASCQNETVSVACFSEWCALSKIKFIRLNPQLEEEIPLEDTISVETLREVVVQTLSYLAKGQGKQHLQDIKDNIL